MAGSVKAVLVDDEKNSRIVLRKLLASYESSITIVGEAGNVNEAYELITTTRPDLVFLDIQMPGGDGFSLLRRFDEIAFDVIFVTSFDKYAINAIRFSALDYLLKPIDVNDLDGAVMKAIRLAEQRSLLNIKIGNLLHNVGPDRLNRKLAVHVRDKVVLVPILDVMYIVAESNWCHIHTSDGEHYMMTKILKEFEDFLEEYPSFIRVHKSFIINTAFIHDYSKGEPCILAMKDGRTFEVARRKKQEVLEKLQRLR